MNEYARTQMTEEEFKPDYDRLTAQYEKLAERIAVILQERK